MTGSAGSGRPDSRHVSLSRCDGVYLLTYLLRAAWARRYESRRARVRRALTVCPRRRTWAGPSTRCPREE